MNLKRLIPERLKTKIIGFLKWASKIRSTCLWPIFKPIYWFIRLFIDIDNLLETKPKDLTDLKLRLYELGFTKQALAELQEMAADNSNPDLQRIAAWELSVWQANQETEQGARVCLELLSLADKQEKDKNQLSRIATLKAECYSRLGKTELAEQILTKALAKDPQADLYLALANLKRDLAKRLEMINKALQIHGLDKISYCLSPDKMAFDCLKPKDRPSLGSELTDNNSKVTVIIPFFNAEPTIQTALDSILNQTWKNLEIFLVDDASTDKTLSVVEPYVRDDPRMHLIKSETNQGPYLARNLALKQASGDFVTCHDADDWSHPKKIELQVQHLLNNPSVLANTSQLARAFSNLKFTRRGNPGYYIQKNMSSLMFRRQPVMDKIGYWDSVRFGADGEFLRRIKKAFGQTSVIDLPTGPLSFLRQSSTSLTGNAYFGYHGYFMGARKEYRDMHDYYHDQAEDLYLDFPQTRRPFPVPTPLKTDKNKFSNPQQFDLIMVSDFRLPGGTTASNLEEIKVQKKMGLRTGLVQMSRYDLSPRRKIHPKIRDLLEDDQAQFVVYGEHVCCNLLILRHPLILQDWQSFIPKIQAKDVRVIINQTPMKHYGQDGHFYYHIPKCLKNLEKYFGSQGIWHPIGPLVRQALYDYHPEDLKQIRLADTDWTNVIDLSAWQRPNPASKSSKAIIGRHSRDDLVKWPSDPQELVKIYPNSGDYEVHILGGAESPQKILGYLPQNWHIFEFGSVDPKDFLAKLDVFVYFTHPYWVESFGRSIFEAMAVGVPVIIPHKYKKLFGQAAIYASPDEVKESIDKLMDNKEHYQDQVRKAWQYVENHFGYHNHIKRLKEILTVQKLRKP